MRSKPLHAVIDFMATFVIPLFYSTINHRGLIQRYLTQLESGPTTKLLAKEYRERCHTLFQILSQPIEAKAKRRNNLIINVKLLEAENQKIKEIIAEAKAFHDQLTEEVEILNKGDEDLNLEKLQTQQQENERYFHNLIQQNDQTIEILINEIFSVEQQITDLTAAESLDDDVVDFFEMVKQFSTNFGDGYELLEEYLHDSPELLIFFSDKVTQHIFRDVAAEFIGKLISANYLIRNHPLPMYLCPQLADDTNFCFESSGKTYRHFDKIMETVKSNELIELESLLYDIQALLQTNKAPITREQRSPDRLFSPTLSTRNDSSDTVDTQMDLSSKFS